MAPHSSALTWQIPWTEEPSGLQSMGLLGVGHDWATSLSLFLSCIGEGNGNPLQCSCLENPREGGAWWAAVYGVTQSRTRLKRLSSSRPSLQVTSGRDRISHSRPTVVMATNYRLGSFESRSSSQHEKNPRFPRSHPNPKFLIKFSQCNDLMN